MFIPIYSIAVAQEEDKNWSILGYAKDLVTINVADDSTLVDNLIHNHLNFSWNAGDVFNVHLEMRNRLFFGDLAPSISNYGELIDVNNGLSRSLVLYS